MKSRSMPLNVALITWWQNQYKRRQTMLYEPGIFYAICDAVHQKGGTLQVKSTLSFVFNVLVFLSLKGALDKYNSYLFISNSTEYFKLNHHRKFQLILPMRFHFMRYFVNSIISRVSHGPLYCLFTEVDFEK